MNILGISAFYHDSAAVILQDGAITAAAQEERFTRKKHDLSFPRSAIKFCLNFAGIGFEDIDYVVFYDKPLIKFERLIETYHVFAPRGILSFAKAMPVWIKEKLFFRDLIKKELKEISADLKKMPELLFPEHHLSHAASAFYPSPFNEAAILTVDGVGEWATTTICQGLGKEIKILKEMAFPHSWGLLYSAFTYYLGFRVNSGEYKLMGLAPYGDPDAKETRRFIKTIKEQLIQIKPDGSLWMNMKYFRYPYALQTTHDRKWEKLFGFQRRKPESEITQTHMNLAYSIQNVTEKGILLLAEEAKRLTDCDNLVMAGGVALNCVGNGKIAKSGIFNKIWIQPAAGDAGGALGAAYACWHIYEGKERAVAGEEDAMQGAYLGPEFDRVEIERVIRKYRAPCKEFEDYDRLCQTVARFIDGGKIIGWFQGRMEWGPRALGNRSIIGDARNPDMQKRLNVKIKFRESFRPFAPSVLSEDAKEYFELNSASPYMLLVADVVKKRRKSIPSEFQKLSLKDKLYFLRSDLPAITHLDYSARVQTVHRKTNPLYWKLLKSFKDLTGYGVIVNTSFNVRGEPIVCTPEDAYRCFMRTEMDFLVMGKKFFAKQEQEKWQETNNWREEYTLD